MKRPTESTMINSRRNVNNRAYGQKAFPRQKRANTGTVGSGREGGGGKKITMARPPSVSGHLIQRRSREGVDSREQAN